MKSKKEEMKVNTNEKSSTFLAQEISDVVSSEKSYIKNGFELPFVDALKKIINALNEEKKYTIELAEEAHEKIQVQSVSGINNAQNPEAVVEGIAQADIVTTAIGPNILPFIAELIAKGIQKRKGQGNEKPLDILACENMIGGSEFLFEKVKEYLTPADLEFVDLKIGFPNAAVDRIVPNQSMKIRSTLLLSPSVNGWWTKVN